MNIRMILTAGAICLATPALAQTAAPGTWNTNFGAMALGQVGATVNGSYVNGGRIYGTMAGRTFTGVWTVPASTTVNCPTAAYGSTHWGRVQWTFNAIGNSFTGTWGACGNGPMTSIWNGARTGGGANLQPPQPAPAPVAAYQPCYRDTYARWSAGPCFGPVGTPIVLRLEQNLTSMPAQLVFRQVVVNGVPARVTMNLSGGGTAAGTFYRIPSPPQICVGNRGKWVMTLITADGRSQGDSGAFTPIC